MAKRKTFKRFEQYLAGHFKINEVSTVNPGIRKVCCLLKTSDYSANLIIWFRSNLRNSPPFVICTEEWLKKEIDWHCSKEGALCWIKDELWKKLHSSPNKSTSLVHAEGAQQLCNDVTSLLNRHYYAKLTGITEWQEEWSDWAHYEVGTNEYKVETSNKYGLPENCEIIEDE